MMKIVFDLDGVIFESVDAEGNYLWCKNIKSDLGINNSQLAEIFSAEWSCVLKGQIDVDEHLCKTLLLFENTSVTTEQFLSYWLDNDTKIKSAVLDFVRSLNALIYLGTNQEIHKTAYIKRYFEGYFKKIFSSSEIGYIKPEPEFFKYIEDTLQTAPEKLILIDDLAENVSAAKTCSWEAFLFQDNLLELKKFLYTHGVNKFR